ncbi:hypothetical protein PO124_21355 [Bacillus licheniformis]|nr:hypothetical protein [Bacillus licheniformis]
MANTFSIRFRTGEFDPDELNPYSRLTDDVINSPKHQLLAKKQAEKPLFTENDQDLLPFNARKNESIAVIGPFGNALYEDWYSGTMPYRKPRLTKSRTNRQRPRLLC